MFYIGEVFNCDVDYNSAFDTVVYLCRDGSHVFDFNKSDLSFSTYSDAEKFLSNGSGMICFRETEYAL